MDILKPEMIIFIAGVVGACEAAKQGGLKLPTVVISLIISIVGGFAIAEPITWQRVLSSVIIIYGVSTLTYETIIKRFRGKDGE
jgi:hypothetical protein